MFSFYSRIIVAYDSSVLSKKALEMAKNLAEQDERIEIHVVSVVYTKNEGDEFGVPDEHIRLRLQENVRKMVNEVKESLEAVSNPTEIAVLKGHPADTILEYAKNRNADLIVVGSRGLSTFKELILGSVSHNVVQQAQCPVLVAK